MNLLDPQCTATLTLIPKLCVHLDYIFSTLPSDIQTYDTKNKTCFHLRWNRLSIKRRVVYNSCVTSSEVSPPQGWMAPSPSWRWRSCGGSLMSVGTGRSKGYFSITNSRYNITVFCCCFVGKDCQTRTSLILQLPLARCAVSHLNGSRDLANN